MNQTLPNSRNFLWLMLMVLATGTLPGVFPARADEIDDPVFRRYEKKVVPSETIRLDSEKKRAVLAIPATEDDVKAGRAIFTLEGLGKTRVWKMPYCPLPATWTSLKQFPKHDSDGNPTFDNFTHVIQAEELKVNGKWERYFGLVTAHGVAVAPAAELDFWLSPSLGDISWMSLSDGLNWGVSFKASNAEPGQLKVGDPLPMVGYIMNCRGIARQVPTDFYHGPDQGGPALRKGVRLILERAPFDPRAADANYPNAGDFKPMTPKSLGVFVPKDRVQELETGESFKVLTADLHDWFEIPETGHYQVRFEFEGMKGSRGCVQTQFGFSLGNPPPVMTVEHLNDGIISLGGKGADERIRKLIDETCNPATSGPAGERNFVWSEASGGLQAMILDISNCGYRGVDVVIALKNVSDHPLVVPVGDCRNQPRSGVFNLEVKTSGGAWKAETKFFQIKGAKQGLLDDDEEENAKKPEQPNGPNHLSFKLAPGSLAVVLLTGKNSPAIPVDAEVRIAMKQSAEIAAAGAWRGTLDTPPVVWSWDETMREALKGGLEFPAFYPAFDIRRGSVNNMSGCETDFVRLCLSNQTLLAALDRFGGDGVRIDFEQRFAREKDMPMKLLLASVAAGRGSKPAAIHLLEMMKQTDYEIVRNLHSAIERLIYHHDSRQPSWLLAMAVAALSDERFVTGLEKTNWSEDTRFTIAHVADEDANLALALGQVQCREAVPFLIEMTRKNKSRMPIMALGAAGDPRAIPVLLEILKTEGESGKPAESDETFTRVVEALSNLRATEAVPALLEYPQYPEVIEALDKIGDRSAIPVLRELVRNKGRVFHKDTEIRPKDAPERLVKSKIALATLEDGDAIPRLTALLGDKSFGEFDRREVIWRLGERADARAIPFLVKAIKTDPSGSVVNQAISVLAVFKYKAAVEGLIACFDADFTGKNDWKRAYEPSMFRENIAESLRDITGQKFGPRKKQWLHWWQSEGKSASGLK